ncbi:hypothetical protein [Polyangium aurulentum]|uniref:hypothetical protein n=1 Tax=Polyangium aurulentum TaxID=2567896 RepID=UPI0010ADE9C3|nr:hypothetical protein [Polyangium aurulentum]UQA59311.1 hypothetical protein E8A73_002015 [Polyangium aurulentum]
MRLALLVQVTATALLLCGCPGADEGAVGSGNTTDGSGASGQGGAGEGGAGQGGAGQGGAGQGGAGQGGAGQGGAGQGGAGGGASACQALEFELNVKLQEAQKCNPAIDVVQCVDVVKGLCCDTIVGKADSPEVQAYLEALKEYQAASCNPTCPAIPCPTMPTGTCKPTGSGAGQCMQQP